MSLPVEEARRQIRAAGLRCTPARLSVLALLAERRSPMSHAEIVDLLGDRGWDRATLYRNLSDLTDAGLLRRSDHGDHVWRYELAASDEGHAEVDHPHFVCTNCGDVACLPGVRIEMSNAGALPAAIRGGSVHVQLRGECDDCAGSR